MDTLTPAQRSKRMALVRNKDTKPEMVVRRLIHGMGYRYRLHSADLPGKPDLVFPGRQKVLFVHGCFWHRHPGCRNTRMPKSGLNFWRPKLESNRERDLKHQEELEAQGWSYLIVWECQVGDELLADRVQRFLDGDENGK